MADFSDVADFGQILDMACAEFVLMWLLCVVLWCCGDVYMTYIILHVYLIMLFIVVLMCVVVTPFLFLLWRGGVVADFSDVADFGHDVRGVRVGLLVVCCFHGVVEMYVCIRIGMYRVSHNILYLIYNSTLQ